MRIVGDWFGWYWGKEDAKLLIKLIEEGMRHVPLDKRKNHRFSSIIRRIKKAMK